jgi:hypothetical protein
LALPPGFLAIVFSYLAVFVLCFLVVAFLLRGFFIPYLRVKGSRGKDILVKVKEPLGNYYRVGKVNESMLLYKDRAKNEKRISLDSKGIYRSIGVTCVDVDPLTNAVVDQQELWTGVPGFDADRFNSLYLRALYRPSILDQKTQAMLIIIIIIGVLMLVSLFMSYQNFRAIKVLTGQVQFLQTLINTTASTL